MALFAIAIVVMIVCKVSDYQKEQKYLKSAQRRKVLKEHPEFRTPKDYWQNMMNLFIESGGNIIMVEVFTVVVMLICAILSLLCLIFSTSKSMRAIMSCSCYI